MVINSFNLPSMQLLLQVKKSIKKTRKGRKVSSLNTDYYFSLDVS